MSAQMRYTLRQPLYQWIPIEMHRCDQTDGETAPDAMRAT